MRSVTALFIDLVLVVVFAGIGRASHNEDVFSGLLDTALPFLVAGGIAWVVLLVRRRPAADLWSGVFVWWVTAMGGLILRVAMDVSARWPFWVVTILVLGVFLVGWRLLAGLILKRRSAA
ncbi:MAG TPA: DUF3054 domain-containing protein [Propionibacteriaceae bacterium]|nr:DUF3054 domain-containing protein [Propionibacteriaceae bacterium]